MLKQRWGFQKTLRKRWDLKLTFRNSTPDPRRVGPLYSFHFLLLFFHFFHLWPHWGLLPSYHSYLSLYRLSAAESRRAIMEIEYNKSFNFKPPQNGHQVMFTCLPRGESAIYYGEIGAQISLALFSGRSISWTCCDEMRAAPASQSLMPNVNSRSLLSPTPCFTSCVIPEIY